MDLDGQLRILSSRRTGSRPPRPNAGGRGCGQEFQASFSAPPAFRTGSSERHDLFCCDIQSHNGAWCLSRPPQSIHRRGFIRTMPTPVRPQSPTHSVSGCPGSSPSRARCPRRPSSKRDAQSLCRTVFGTAIAYARSGRATRIANASRAATVTAT